MRIVNTRPRDQATGSDKTGNGNLEKGKICALTKSLVNAVFHSLHSWKQIEFGGFFGSI